jgi:hypothetical protein
MFLRAVLLDALHELDVTARGPASMRAGAT